MPTISIHPSLYLPLAVIDRASAWGKAADVREVFIVPDPLKDTRFVAFLGQINDEWYGGFYRNASSFLDENTHWCWSINRRAQESDLWKLCRQHMLQSLSEIFQAYEDGESDG